MAVPKKKTSTSKRNQRRSHDGLKRVNYGVNKTTGELQLPHQISIDGYYKGKKVIKEKVKKAADAPDASQVQKLEKQIQALEKEAPKAIEKEAPKKVQKKEESKKTESKESSAKPKTKVSKKEADKSDSKKS